MHKRILPFLLTGLLICCLPLLAQDNSSQQDYKYKGANWCKMCHRQDNIYSSWQETAHAGAYDVLPAEFKDSKQCRACHVTAVTAVGKVLEGVQCEACHGPGSAYSKQAIMEDREASLANGLIIPDRETCVRCHTDQLPPECGEPTHGKFAFELMKPLGTHVLGVYPKPSDSVEVMEEE